MSDAPRRSESTSKNIDEADDRRVFARSGKLGQIDFVVFFE